MTTEVDCASAGNAYQGDNTGCDPNPCPLPTGACCYADGSCLVQTAGDCTGIYQGDFTSCDPNPCPQPTGACFVDFVCTITTANDCAGTYYDDG